MRVFEPLEMSSTRCRRSNVSHVIFFHEHQEKTTFVQTFFQKIAIAYFFFPGTKPTPPTQDLGSPPFRNGLIVTSFAKVQVEIGAISYYLWESSKTW